ncbi:MAG: S-adenosylmethionine:tRNA ribosyltransferase-isomerase [bacterium]|nr:S-adenosylmethionine:tRNA ribosyltransferase-isomerase [bacterium]
MHPKDLSISDYTYPLPNEKIAVFPLKQRDQSKLLVYHKGNINDHQFKELPTLLPSKSLLVFNNTLVVHARILFHRESGAQIEIFCLEPMHGDYPSAFSSNKSCVWKCLIGNSKRWKGEILQKDILVGTEKINFTATLLEKQANFSEIKFEWDNENILFGNLLFHAGILPLPPYLNRDAEAEDELQYQTTYAKEKGSVAAPTAGLHFTDETFSQLAKQDISTTELTLHVGAGTFMPVKSETMLGHEMHQEHFYVSLNTINDLLNALALNSPIIAVGTTSLRTIESLYWLGVRLLKETLNQSNLLVKQWDPYELRNDIGAIKAFEAVQNFFITENIQELRGITKLLIAPGYQFKIANAIVTNFHQPNSTLLLLIAALVGEEWKTIYGHALEKDYRFLSFGDSSLLWRS